MINEHTQGYTILYKSNIVEKENNCEEGSMYKYVCTYKVTPALFYQCIRIRVRRDKYIE